MNDIRKLSGVACLLLCLAACGGGEDGNEGWANPVASRPSLGRAPSTQPASTGALPNSNTLNPGGQITDPGTGAETSTDTGSPASTTVVVFGVVRAEVPPENLKTSALNYKAMSYQNIRGATVELLDATSNAILADGTTDANGFYSLTGPVNTRVLVRIKAQLRSTSSNSGRYNISVNDNTNGYALYVLDSTTFDTGNVAAIALNLSANSGWSGTAYTDVRASPPFAILDTVYKSLQKLTQVSPNIEMPDVKLMWSLNNTTARGDKALGQIGTSHYSGFDARKEVNAFAEYILGKADVDTDEFDGNVVAHEFGHYLQVTQFRDHSPGGSHGGGDRLDMRLAFSEGWGNAWNGIASIRSIYTDSSGPGQSQGFAFDLPTGDTYGSKGWFSEASIQYILTMINRVAGFKPIWNALTSEQFRYGAPVTVIHSFLAALDNVIRGNATVQAALFGDGIVSNDAWGTGGLNGGGLIGEKSVLPIYKSYLMRGLASQYCLSIDCGMPNKWGNTQFVRLTIPESKVCAIAVSGAGPSRPNMLIFQNGRPIYFPDSVLMNGAVVVQLGQVNMTLALSDAQLRSLGTSCLNLTIN